VGQGRQAEDELAPRVEENVPAGQGVQTSLPNAAQLPKGQHNVEFAPLYVPFKQGVHWAARPLLKVLAGQGMGWLALDVGVAVQ